MRFDETWFDKYPDQLEYSITEDITYCLYCYLFRTQNNQGGADSFVEVGFNNWKKKERFDVHVGGHSSFHNQFKKCQDLMNQNLTGNVSTLFTHKANKERTNYRIRLNAAVISVRLCLNQGLSFRYRNESELLRNKGNYLEVFHLLADNNEQIKNESFENAHLTSQLVSSDICKVFVAETTSMIIKDIGDKFFTILVDESRDASMKEQMTIYLRYVNNEGRIIERFHSIKHVPNTIAALLKETVEELPRTEEKTNDTYFRIECFYGVLDKQLME